MSPIPVSPKVTDEAGARCPRIATGRPRLTSTVMPTTTAIPTTARLAKRTKDAVWPWVARATAITVPRRLTPAAAQPGRVLTASPMPATRQIQPATQRTPQ